MRGHVFGNTDNSHLIISFKGTSAGIFNGEPTGEKDKLNVKKKKLIQYIQTWDVYLVLCRITCCFLAAVVK